MTLFWIVAAALLAAVLVVLLRPLLKPARVLTDDTAASNLRVLRAQLAELDGEHAAGRLDAEQHAAARAELERRVLEEGGGDVQHTVAQAGRPGTIALALAVPLVAFGLYLQLGNRSALDPEAMAAQEHAAMQDMEVAVARLAEKMKEKPDNADGWALLGRSYAQLGRFEESREAYARALKLGREDAQLLAEYADASAMAQGRRFTPEVEALVTRALALDPDHLKSLALAGTAAMARGDHALAVKHWTRAREQAPPQSELAQGLAAGIAEARAAGGLVAQAAPAAANRASAPASAPAVALRVTVAIAPALAAKVQPSDTLFVFARAAEGPRMPLAIAKITAAALPAQVQLDDSMAMTPQMRLSAFSSVVVVARISKKGAAAPEPGDLEGESTPRAPSGSTSVTIDRVRP